MSSDQNIVPAITETQHQLDVAVREKIEQIEPDSDPADALTLYQWIDELVRLARGWKSEMEGRFASLLDQQGEIQAGDKRYYCGTAKKYKPVGHEQILDALLDFSGGDTSVIAECLSSGAWKQGQIKQVVGEEKHGELFAVEKQIEPKTGKPKRGVKVIDERFTR